jgi:hypothetical protein
MPVARITGTHLLADFYDIDADRLNDAHALARILLDAARAARMTPLSTPVVLRFAGGGLTGFLPLAESHIAFHTYPNAATWPPTCLPAGQIAHPKPPLPCCVPPCRPAASACASCPAATR